MRYRRAWSAIATTPIPQDDPAKGVFRVDHLRLALDAAVRGGSDTDTVAAIAGGLLGAAYGASAVPAEWRRVLHGWPGIRTRDLVELASTITRKGRPDGFDFSLQRVRDGHGRPASLRRWRLTCGSAALSSLAR